MGTWKNLGKANWKPKCHNGCVSWGKGYYPPHTQRPMRQREVANNNSVCHPTSLLNYRDKVKAGTACKLSNCIWLWQRNMPFESEVLIYKGLARDFSRNTFLLKVCLWKKYCENVETVQNSVFYCLSFHIYK